MTDPTAVLESLLDARWSCRAFRPDPVPRSDIERMLAMAQRTASWCNTQSWHAIVTSGVGTDRFRAALAEHVRSNLQGGCDVDPLPAYEGVYRERRREQGWALYDAVGVTRGDREASARQTLRNFDLFDAPHLAVVTTDAGHGEYGTLDAGLYVGTLLLAATSLGVATIAQASIALQAPFVRAWFGIPADRRILVGIAFGYADGAHPANGYRTARAPLAEAVRWVDA